MKNVKIGSLKDTHIIDETDFVCLDICRERMIKRISKSEKIKGKVKNPPEEDKNSEIKLDRTDLYCYKAWRRIQSKSKGEDTYTEVMKKCEENDTYYMPISRKESDMVMTILQNSSKKTLLRLLSMSIKNMSIKNAEKVINIRIGEDTILRHIIKNIKKASKENETLYVISREERIKDIISKIEFETTNIKIERL